MISVEIEGAKELEDKLMQIEKKTAKKIVRAAVRKAQKTLIPAIKAALSAISKGGGMAEKISRALQVRAARKNPPGTYSVHVQIKSQPDFVYYPKGSHSTLGTRKTIGKRSFIPAAIEYGHGKNKEQAARPFMRPAAESTEDSRIKIFTQEVIAGLNKIWNKK